MDQDRQIRLLIPPFFLFASLLWGAHLGGMSVTAYFKPESAKELLGLLAATAVVLVPIGFMIGVISVLLLALVGLFSQSTTYEARMSSATLERIWNQLQLIHKAEKEPDWKLSLYAGTTFDHELLSDGVHTWLLRRWNSFNVAVNSIVALFLAHLVGYVFSLPQTCRWWITTVVAAILLGMFALKAWREVMAMIDFQSYREQKKGEKDARK
jgi:hypothetical protein